MTSTVISIIAATVNSGNLGREVAVQYKKECIAWYNYICQDGTYIGTVHNSGRYICQHGIYVGMVNTLGWYMILAYCTTRISVHPIVFVIIQIKLQWVPIGFLSSLIWFYSWNVRKTTKAELSPILMVDQQLNKSASRFF